MKKEMNSFLSEYNLKEVYENNVVGLDIINNEKVFEEILSEILFRGDSSLLEKFTELTSKYSKVSELDKLKTLFTKVKHKLYLRRVPIPLPMNIRLTNSIVKLSLKLNLLLNADPECPDGFYNTKESLVKYFKEFQNQICISIKQLLECPSINNRFVYLCSYVASKINIIKKLFKRLIIVNNHDGCLFSHFPWEQIQFILAIFVRRFNKDIPVLILYTAILTEEVIKEHLSNFLKHFETFTIDEEIRVDSTEIEKKKKDKKSKNDNSINVCDDTEKISFASMEYCNQTYYKRLLEDFWSVKNIYSLHLINTHIDMALSVNVNDEHFNILAIERCLLIIGEFTKCSSDSPHLSDDLRNELISLMPLHFQDCVKHLRNNLSHVFETRHQDSSMTTFSEYNAKQVQQDLIKIKDNFNFVLNKHKYIVIKRLFVSIRQCVSCDQVLQLFPLHTLNLLCSETDMLALKYNNVTTTFIKEKINSINSLVTESSSDEEKCFINKLYNEIAGKYPRLLMNDKVFRCLSYHLNYLVSLKGGFGARYKQLLDTLIDSLPSFLNINDYIIRDLSFTIKNLMNTTNSKDIFKMAEDLYSYINVNMKSLKGIRDIRDNYRENKGEKGKPFLVSLTEVNNILNCIIYNLNEPLVNFVKEKVNKEVAFYSKITELIETVQCLKKDKCMDSQSKIERVRWLIGTDNTELDLTMLKALDNKNFDLCEKSILAKYKKDRKCKYEKLVRDFMKPENNYLEAKVRLITEFLKNIKVNKSKELEYKEYSSTEEVIRSQYLVNIKQLIEQLYEINEKYLNSFVTCCDFPITYRDYRHVRSCYEMLILKVLELSQRLGGGGNASTVHTLRPDQVLNCGRSLRNYLAHHDVIYDIFTFEVDTVIESLALEIGSLDPKCIPNLNYFLPREQITFDWAEEEKYFGNEALCIVDLQDHMFKAVASDNLNELKRCLSVGADPRGMDVQNRNALQFAFDNSSTACFEYLVNLLPVIKISRHNAFGVMQHCGGRGCITLDACSPLTLIKLLGLILKFPYFSKLFQINEYPEKEVKHFMNNKFVSCVSFDKNIIDYFHIMVYLNERNMIKKMCNLGMKRVYDTDANDSSALLWAATLGLTDVCQQFINEINKSDYNDCSPLYYALIHGKWETVSFLTTHGAQCSPNLDPVVVGVISGREVWVREHLQKQGIKPFFNEDGCFNIYTFGYAMSNCDITTGVQLLNYINDLRGNPVTVDFIAAKTKALSFNHFYKLVFGFILSGLCFIGNIDIIKIMFEHMKEYFSYEIKDIEIATFKCEDLFNEDPNFDLYYIFRRNSLIHLACYSSGDNKELIKYLINEGADCTEVSGFGETPLELSMQLKNTDLCLYLLKKIDFAASIRNSLLLHLASSNGLLEVCKELIDKGINLEFQSDEKRTSLHYATLNGHSDIVNIILKQNDLNIQNGFKNIVNIKDTHGNTALRIACSRGYFDIVKLLLDCKAIVHCTEWENDNVVAAVTSGNDKILRLILHQIPVENQSSVINQEIKGNYELFSKYNDLNKITHASSKGKLGPVLILAVELGHYKIVQTLINCGGDLNCCGILGRTPLHMASFEGHVDLVKAILPYANDIDVGDCDNNSPLFLAMINNHLNVASLLICKGADVNRLNNNRDTLLHFAINFNAHECIKLIEPLTSLIDTKNKNGVNQIMIAALRGNVDVIKSLLQRNVTIDKSALDNPLFIALAFNNTEAAAELLNKFTIDDISHPCLPYLHCAIKLHNYSFLELLLNKGLSPNFKNSCGFAGVHLAAALGCIDCLKVLLRYNSDINLRSDYELFTPLHLATFHNKIDMVSYLLESGAHINSHGENFITPLYLAITMEHLDILKIFIDKGVRLDVRGPRGSMFTYAYISGREDIAEIILDAAATKTDRMCRVPGKVYNKVKGNAGTLSLSMSNIPLLSKMNKEKYKDEYYNALKDDRNAWTEYMNALFSDSSMLVDSSPNIGTTQCGSIINNDASNNGDRYINDPNHNNLMTKDDNLSKKLNDIWFHNKSLSWKSYEI